MINRNVKIAVIGGGAAGLAAAAAAGKKFGKGCAVIIEKQNRTGRKLLATGNGRCNISNQAVSEIHYRGDRAIIHSVISDFSFQDCKNFFEEQGIILRKEPESWRVYPYSNQASTVLDVLRSGLKRYDIEELCGFNITSITRKNNQFIICSDDCMVFADYIIFATGSKASPSLGADDSGYRLLEKSGIAHSALYPALSPIATKEKYKILKGVRAKGKVTLLGDGRFISEEYGEIQFSDSGISGICIFNLSGFVNEFFEYGTIGSKEYDELTISIDLMQEYDDHFLCQYIKKCRNIFKDEKSELILSAVLNKKLSSALMRYAKIHADLCRDISDKEIKRIAYAIKHFTFTPIRSDAYGSAQVCGGGIGSKEIDPDTLMSRKIKNLYICGELLDVYGECGGYNLHFTFGSALKAINAIK